MVKVHFFIQIQIKVFLSIFATMQNQKKISLQIIGVILFITLLYLFFPTNNSTLDAYGYATSIRYGEELFKPHHLLYNVFQYFIYKLAILLNFNISALALSKMVNSIFQFGNLFLVYLILKNLKVKYPEILYIILILGFGHSAIRFGTENENYIIPITFSLLGSYYFLKFTQIHKKYYLFLSGLFASIACLFHQIHIFWWLGLLFGVLLYFKKLKYVLYYSVSVLIIPISYILVIYFYNHQDINLYSITHFVLHDYYTGTAKSEFGIHNFILTFISSIRTFFQIHPVILILIKKNIWFVIPLFFLFYLIFITLKLIYQKRLFHKNPSTNQIFINTHIFIFILSFLFSFYAVGNIEFMIMLPFILFISLFQRFKLHQNFLKTLAFTLIIWNFTYVLYTNNKYQFYNDSVLVEFIKKHPNDIFLVDQHTVINQLEYETGIRNPINVFRVEKLNSIDELPKINKNYFYTDVIDKPKILNRSSFLQNKKLNLSGNKKELILSYDGLYGSSKIYKVYF